MTDNPDGPRMMVGMWPSKAGEGTHPLDGTQENPDSLVCAKCATYQHDVSYHDDDPTPEITATLTGDCEIDCQERCAYPGQFSECSMPENTAGPGRVVHDSGYADVGGIHYPKENP